MQSIAHYPAQETPDFTLCTVEANSNLVGNKNGIGSFHKGITYQGHKYIREAKQQEDVMPIGMEHSKASNYVQQSCHETIQDLNSSGELTKSIPDHVLKYRHKYSDYRACIQQNGESFGFVPLTPLQLYNGDSVKWDSTPDTIHAHHIIRESGLPNFLGARIPVKSQLKPCRWHYHLKEYWDKQLPDLIQFGFPLDFDRRQPLCSTDKNHTSALENPQHVAHYISEELSYGAIYGPFEKIPFTAHMSPLMVRDKQNSDKKRTIIDLSWPKSSSVNDNLQTYFTLRYPSVDLITQALCELGPNALIYKLDISRAFRHLRIDPEDIDLLGIKHNACFIDGSLPFGFRHGSLFSSAAWMRYALSCSNMAFIVYTTILMILYMLVFLKIYINLMSSFSTFCKTWA